MKNKAKNAILTVLAVIGFALIFGAVGHLDYMDLTKQACGISDILPQLIWGALLMMPGLVEVIK